MRSKIDDKSEAQGFPESRLPQFTAEESGINQLESSIHKTD